MLCVCVSSVSYYIWSVCLYYGEGRSKVRLGVTKKLKNKNWKKKKNKVTN